MLIIIIFRSSLKLGYVGSKTRSLGQQATQVSDLGPLWPSCITNRTKDTFIKSTSEYFMNVRVILNEVCLQIPTSNVSILMISVLVKETIVYMFF